MGSGAATCHVASNLASGLGRALVLQRVPRLPVGHEFQA
jgi:hypothetical protein